MNSTSPARSPSRCSAARLSPVSAAALIRFLPVAALALCGCQGPQPIRADLAAAAVRVEAVAKSGYREGASDGYTASDAPLNAGAFERVDYGSLRDIVVWVEPAGGSSVARAAANGEVVLTAQPVRTPPVVLVSVGGALSVENRGSLTEEVYSVAEGLAVNLGAIAPGEKRQVTLERPGVFELLSSTRAAPLATIFVTPSPWAMVSAAGKTLLFNDLPPGAATVHAWHLRLPAESAKISLPAGGGARLQLRVGVDALD